MSPNLQRLQEFYDTVWLRGEVDAAARFFASDRSADGLYPGLEVEAREIGEFAAAVLAHVEVDSVTLIPTVEQEDWVAARLQIAMRRRDTDQPLASSAMVMVRLRDGLFVEAHNAFDFLGFFELLGLVPQDAAALCLAGHRLR